MAKIIEKTGKTVEEALNAALEELGVTAENVQYEVLENPSKGFFGFGAKPAKIQVTLNETPDEVEDTPVEKIETHIEEKIEPVLEETKFEAENTPAENVKSDFDREAVIANAKNFLAEVFGAMKIEIAVNAVDNDSEVVLNLVGENLGVLIGKHGQTLDALQYLTNLAANPHDAEEKIYFVLDVEKYRERRAVALTKLAKSVAERAARTRQDIRLEPMSRSERKIIHTTLQNNSKVETHSAGEDPYRYIVVSPKRKR